MAFVHSSASRNISLSTLARHTTMASGAPSFRDFRTLRSAATGEAKNFPSSRRCQAISPVAAWRQVTTGSFLNFGIDFAGGSQVRLALDADKDPGVDALRPALEEFGYESSSVVTVPDAEHEVLVRVKDTVSIDEAQVESLEHALALRRRAALLAVARALVLLVAVRPHA